MVWISVVIGCDEYERIRSNWECLCLGRATHYSCSHGGRILCLRLLAYLSLMCNGDIEEYLAESSKWEGEVVYGKHESVCLETQGFTNAINKTKFRSIVVQPGVKYHHSMLSEFSIEYIIIVKKHGLEISQSAIEPNNGLTWQTIKTRGGNWSDISYWLLQKQKL
ncbi:aldose 1-epimerase [Tanacetum coccineum]|uniref:Aldose 1-epimerase n=1 Tax=Tanacetum coccineum TaxID=301880 RepID=A0ABQ5FYE6_9ASTR